MFLTPLPKTAADLGINLGTQNYVSICDVPFGCFLTNTHDFGQSYLQMTDDETVEITAKPRSGNAGTSQLIVFLDIALNLSYEEDLCPKFFDKFTIQGQTFSQLTLDNIESIKQVGSVTAHLNLPEFSANAMQSHQIIFHSEKEKPQFGEAYRDKSIAWQNRAR